MSGHRPVPRSDTDQYLSVVADGLDAVSATLNGIRELLAERLPVPGQTEATPKPAPDSEPVVVELKEPDPAKKAIPAKRQPPKRG